MRILILGDPNSPFIQHYVSNFKRVRTTLDQFDLFGTFRPFRYTEADCFDNIYHIGPKTEKYITSRWQYFLRILKLWNFLRQFRGKYDIIHVFYAYQDLLFIYHSLRKFAPKIIITVFGSDFYRLKGTRKRHFKKVFEITTFITFANRQTLEDFKAHYGEISTLTLCRFGLEPLKYLKNIQSWSKNDSRKHLLLPEEKIIICIGYNYDSIQQHIPILQSIANTPACKPIKDQLLFIIPMTNGTEEPYRQLLLQALNEFPFEKVIFERFLSDEEIAHLRKIPDIMIQLQSTDQFSGSMQEHLFAGNLVITGSWLPYRTFEEQGIYFRKIDHVRQIGEELVYCINHLDEELAKCKNNPDAVYTLSSWDSVINSWIKLYQDL
jgi:hypothetical protein